MTTNLNEIIRKNAAAEWPDDYEMQVHYIESQTNAVRNMNEILQHHDKDDQFINEILLKAESDYPEDFEMQLHVFQSQIEAANSFFQYTHATIPDKIFEEIKTKAYSEWPNDYEMMLHVLEKQLEAWEQINKQ